MRRSLVVVLGALALAACKDSSDAPRAAGVLGSRAPDELPRMTNAAPPFRYPASLYDRKVQADVMLRLFIDEHGGVRAESTQVVTSSGHAALDTAAIEGARRLSFVPAKRGGEAIAVSVLFPVLFRHPEAAPLPGDTAFRGVRADTGRTAAPRAP